MKSGKSKTSVKKAVGCASGKAFVVVETYGGIPDDAIIFCSRSAAFVCAEKIAKNAYGSVKKFTEYKKGAMIDETDVDVYESPIIKGKIPKKMPRSSTIEWWTWKN